MQDSTKTARGTPLNPRWRELNAFTYLDAGFDPLDAGALSAGGVSEPTRPLAGYSLAIKDNIEVAGMPCTCGTPALRTYVPKIDAPAIARLRCAGAQIIGKTNMHELAYGITSNNAAFGPVSNAFDPSCFAGGSSGGTAVAIAAGVVRAGLGTDTGGSSRIPAALNGIVGFRPSIGRYPMGGVARISPTRDVIGPMARDVGDVALLDAVLSGDATARLAVIEVRGLRIGLPEQHFHESLHADMFHALERVIASLKEAGAIFIKADLPNVAALNAAVSLPIVLHETKASLQSYVRDTGLQLSLQQLHEMIASPDVKELVGLAITDHVSQQDYEQALNVERPRLQRLYRDYFAAHGVEAVLFPTTPLPACPIEGSDQTVVLNGARAPTFATFIRNTDPASNAGIPAISLPAGSSSHLPLGIELDGPAGTDRRLLAIAAAIAAALSASFEAAP
jgi:Asp-tRNA(Asn)/Glu-tRNA(Gln) amidotransferase A subunit family amidase